MAYSYGHRATSANGIWLWLQGQSNQKRKDYKGINYVPKGDKYKTADFVGKIIVRFYNEFAKAEVTQKHYNRNRRLALKMECFIQENFHKFTKFVKENYEPN